MQVSKKYVDILASEQPPHVYAVADACYHNLFKMRKDQCAVISGESGAGKTVSAKHIIRHIIDISSADQEARTLEDRIIQVRCCETAMAGPGRHRRSAQLL